MHLEPVDDGVFQVDRGSMEAVKDHTRDVGRKAELHSVWQDVCYALRLLRRSPGFTVAAVVTLPCIVR
ncbi:MAG: hypothetical protein GEV06_20075 [Luteitalea sp.]|nr:hypothetical protein [Luteitalea sp.]